MYVHVCCLRNEIDILIDGGGALLPPTIAGYSGDYLINGVFVCLTVSVIRK